ncbi:MAG: hypothetical protein KAT15_32165 [Bacteroidales bacterium]|nr:hypothetical protein [Bacteroidales bacterium]
MKRMNYKIIAGLGFGLLLVFSPVRAQYEVDLFGYFEPQYLGAVIKNEYIQLQSNKLRVDLEAKAFDKVYFGANFDFITYHGKTSWNILDYLPDDLTSVIPPEYHDYYVFPFENRIFLDNAYLKFALKHVDITVGRQQISIGSGYVWNPTDMFNTRDVLDPTYEQPGHNAIRADVPIGSRFGLTGLYAVGDDWDASDKMIQFKGGISRFDFSILAAEKIWVFHDYTQIDPETFYYVAMPEKRQMIGGSMTGELFGLGVWAEYGYSFMETSDDFYELTVGTDYTFDFQTYILLEYYRNTLARDDHRDYTFNDWMRFMAAEQKAMGRDQVYGLIQHPITDLMYLGMSGIYCISDNSAALVPTLNYLALDNLELLLYLNFYLGKDGTAYASNLGNGGMVRARIYF